MKMEDLKPGQVHTQEGFILLTQYGSITHANCEMKEHGYITVCPHTLIFTIPDGFNAVQEAVKAIDAQMDQERGELAEKLQRLQAKKNELLQLTYGGNTILDAEKIDDCPF